MELPNQSQHDHDGIGGIAVGGTATESVTVSQTIELFGSGGIALGGAAISNDPVSFRLRLEPFNVQALWLPIYLGVGDIDTTNISFADDSGKRLAHLVRANVVGEIRCLVLVKPQPNDYEYVNIKVVI